MFIPKLRRYIDENVQELILQRAKNYYPEMVSNSPYKYNFTCQGSQKVKYKIEVKLNADLSISSSCTCPYDGIGICKHQAASLQLLIKFLEDRESVSHQPAPKKQDAKKSPSKKIQKNRKILLIPHSNGIINRDELSNISFRTEYYKHGKMEINSISKTKIQASYNEFRAQMKLNLVYSTIDDEISLSCSCNTHPNCFHKLEFLREVKNRFGLDFFSPMYETIVKDEVLANRKLHGKINFDDAFELEVDLEGVHIHEKVQNLLTHPSLLFEPIPSAQRKEMLKPTAAATEMYRLAFCIEMHYEREKKNKVRSIFPIIGKLNKQKTEITTKIRAIYTPEAAATNFALITPEEANLLLEGVQVSEIFLDVLKSNFKPEKLIHFLSDFKSFLKHSKNYQIFIHDVHDNFAKKSFHEIAIEEATIQLLLKITQQQKFYKLEFSVQLNDKTYPIDAEELIISPLGILLQQTLYLVSNPEQLRALISFSQLSQVHIINQGVAALKKEIITPYSRLFTIEYDELSEKPTKKRNLQPIKQLFISEAEEGQYIIFQPLVAYGKHQVELGSSEKIWLSPKKLEYLKRDRQMEEAFLALVQNLHPSFEDKTDFFYILTEDALESFWIMEAIEKLKAHDVQVFGLADLKGIRYNLNKPNFNIGVSSGTDWFDMHIDIEFGDQKVDLKSLQKSIVKKSNYVELSDGSIGVLPEHWIEKYQKYFKLGQVKKDKIEISNFQFNIIDELYEEMENSPDFLKELYEKKKRLSNLQELREVKPSRHLKASLRDYQKEGLNWMVFLHENKLGGILADDMGLGKTVQSIAFLLYLKEEAKKTTLPPTLIVAPTSLMFNWVAELEKFAPKLTPLLFYGSQREELKERIAAADVVLTTYGSLIKDIEFHKSQHYNYVILDESQAIKNPQSQRYKAVRVLACNNRLALTGTPIENNTFDLYSQFNFINPGIFGSVKHFRTTFSEAIDKDQDEETSALLAKMIHPFILRRTKDQVATELPSKTEGIIYCEMGKKQRKVYEDYKLYFRQKLQEQIETEGVKKSQMYILQGLTKLRQICNSTALADKEKDYGNYSAKLDELTTHLKEKVNKHKVLVFSQFVGMLELVKERLLEEEIEFEYLDGQTRNREERVNNFQQNKHIRVFLISLKAGGIGLNLTEADYVYLIDPWWNPAVESQAIDRCYRIGQEKKVMAYRMICKNSIEEKITALQDKKKTVAAEVIRTDLEKKSFNQKDVAMLFGD